MTDRNTLSTTENLLGIAILSGLFLPHTNTFFLLVNPILCVLLKMISTGNSLRSDIKILVIISLVISICANLPFITGIKPFLSAATILLYLMCFPMVGNIRIKNVYFVIALSIILISQLSYVFRITFIMDFVDNYYPYEEFLENYNEYMRQGVEFDNMFSFRLGGIFRNSNQGARYTTIILAAFLVENWNRRSNLKVLFIFATVLSILFTGSRTGMLVTAVSLTVYMYKTNYIKKGIRTLITISFITALLYILFNDMGSLESVRAFSVKEGMGNSVAPKLAVLVDYLSNENSVFKLLFGYLDERRFHSSSPYIMNVFDSEYGGLIFCYGFCGFLMVILYIISIYRTMRCPTKFFFIVFLWVITSTIILSFRASFLVLLLLSRYYCLSRDSLSSVTIKH